MPLRATFDHIGWVISAAATPSRLEDTRAWRGGLDRVEAPVRQLQLQLQLAIDPSTLPAEIAGSASGSSWDFLWPT